MKNSLGRLFLAAVALSSLLVVANQARAVGPQSQLYLTAGDEQTIWVVQGPSVVNSWTEQNVHEYAVAVDTSVRTLGRQTGELGSQYGLNGFFTGITFPYPLGPTTNIYDATTDGAAFNYSVDYNSGDVYSFNRDWTNPTYLFTASSSGFLGIAFDSTDNTLWLANFNGTNVEHRSLFGTLLSSFNVPFTAITSLALDPADGTLWMGTQASQGNFFQFTKTGVQVGAVFYPALSSQNTLGGEFVATKPAILEINGAGSIIGPSGKKAQYQFSDVENEVVRAPYFEGVLAYQDKAARISFQTGKITSVIASANEAQVQGTAKVGKQTVTFTIHVLGNQTPATNNTFSISLSNGYSASGNINPSGSIQINPGT